MGWLDSIADTTDMALNKLWETVEHRGAWRAAVHGVTKTWTRLSDETTSCKSFLEETRGKHAPSRWAR